MGVSIRQYAKHRGVRHSAVQKAITSRRITQNPDGTIDPERADMEWGKNTLVRASTPRVARMTSSDGSDPISAYLKARAVKVTFEAKEAQASYEEKIGQLIKVSRALEYATTLSAIVRDHVMAQADRLSPMAAALEDEGAIHRLIKKDGEVLLQKVARAIKDAGLSVV